MAPSRTAPDTCRDGVGRSKSRVSLACLPCRSRHLKCNAVKPSCDRCVSDGVLCKYGLSLRRGHRRSRLHGEPAGANANYQATGDLILTSPTSLNNDFGTPNGSGLNPSPGPSRVLDSGPLDVERSTSIRSRTATIDDDLIGLYYTYFHAAHPCALPRWALQHHSATHDDLFEPILLVMQYIGSLFDPAVDSAPVKERALGSLPCSPQSTGTLSPHQIQAMLLYSIAAYWSDEVERSLEILDKLIRGALELQMNLASFATQHGNNDPVVEESWRRTWWQIHVIETLISGSTHTYPTRVSNADMDALLPCEEDCYDSGEIPPPRTLDEYDMREFLPEDDPGFSSFAHLVGLTRTWHVVLSLNSPTGQNATAICAQADISLSAWRSLLPQSKQQLFTSRGDLDVQLFKANMFMNTYIVDIHRRLSDLEYSTVESVARCAPPPPAAKPRSSRLGDTHSVHTAKALLAIRRISDLLPLPSDIVTQTPFVICMIANTMVAHLSACRYLFRGQTPQLQLERERVRSGMGALRALGEHWALGRRTYREMGIIAREILGLEDRDIPRVHGRVATPRLPPDLSLDVDSALFDFQSVSQDMFSLYGAFPTMDDMASMDA